MLGLFPFVHEYFQNEMYKHIYTDSSYPSHCTFRSKNKPQFTIGYDLLLLLRKWFFRFEKGWAGNVDFGCLHRC